MYRLEMFYVNKNGKVKNEMFICDDMVSVSRILLTFKPIRGYEFQGSEITAI